MLPLKGSGLVLIALLLTLIAFAQPNISRMEYFVDTDPGLGNGTVVSIPAGSKDLSDLVINVDPTALAPGVHVLVVRAKDANGNWSYNNRLVFAKGYASLPPEAPAPVITEVEYFVDADPGLGNAIPVSIPAGSKDLSDLVINVDPTVLTPGAHVLVVRAKDAGGSWSYNNRLVFAKGYAGLPPEAPASAITTVEYFVDTDPGIGHAIPLVVTPQTDINGLVSNINVSGLSAGDHIIGFRAKNAHGNWGYNYLDTVHLPALLPAPAITVNSVNKSILCAKDSLLIGYHATGTFIGGNVFTAYISDAAGDFAGEEAIGMINSTGSGIIACELPDHLADGSGYKVRVKSSDAGVTGDASTFTFTVHDRSVNPGITGPVEANTGIAYSYSVSPSAGSTWEWFAPSASITPSANSAGVTWNIAGQPQTIRVVETNQYGCGSDTSTQLVNVYTLKIDNVAASSLTPCPSGELTITAQATGAYDAGNGFTAQLSDASGSFASPVNIGTVAAGPAGLSEPVSIEVVLPYSLANGSGYRIRIVASSPVVTSGDNGQDIVINKPSLGPDKSLSIGCAGGTGDIMTLYNTTGYANVAYSAATPSAATAGVYTLIVTNANGCKDTANITVQDASTAIVPANGSLAKTASRECNDAQGWTHYYNNNGTPGDYSDDIRILSLHKNGNDIGTVGDGTFQLTAAATSGAGSNHAVKLTSPLVPAGSDFLSMNRYWNITATTQPVSPVGVRFYYNSQDLNDVKADDPEGTLSHDKLTIYKLTGGNPDPVSGWAGAGGISYYTFGMAPSLTDWTYTDLGNNLHQAEFLVSSFSGGGAGALIASALPVKFVAFTAIAEKNRVLLQWSTATEVNSRDFLIQRSLDGIRFETIGTTAAAGSSDNLRSYSFDDLTGIHLPVSHIYYRITETDKDGRSETTGIRLVDITGGVSGLFLQANPVDDEAILNYMSHDRSEVIIRVADHWGQVVQSVKVSVIPGKNQIRIATGKLARGIYTVELRSSKDHQAVRMMKK